jgi:type IV pilus assembly protein PilO
MKLSDPVKLPTISQLNLHIAGVALLVIMNVVNIVLLGLAFRDLGSSHNDQLQQEELQLAQLRIQAARLNGLPEKVELSRKDADKFYLQRIPPNYSSFLSDIGALVKKDNVHFTRASYTHAPALQGLAEVRIDANVAGEYSGVMHFINDLERDKTLYVINALTLTGQQGGLVNLRLKLTTYLHAEDASQLPTSSPDDEQPTPGSTDQSALRSAPVPGEER